MKAFNITKTALSSYLGSQGFLAICMVCTRVRLKNWFNQGGQPARAHASPKNHLRGVRQKLHDVKNEMKLPWVKQTWAAKTERRVFKPRIRTNTYTNTDQAFFYCTGGYFWAGTSHLLTLQRTALLFTAKSALPPASWYHSGQFLVTCVPPRLDEIYTEPLPLLFLLHPQQGGQAHQ